MWVPPWKDASTEIRIALQFDVFLQHLLVYNWCSTFHFPTPRKFLRLGNSTATRSPKPISNKSKFDPSTQLDLVFIKVYFHTREGDTGPEYQVVWARRLDVFFRVEIFCKWRFLLGMVDGEFLGKDDGQPNTDMLWYEEKSYGSIWFTYIDIHMIYDVHMIYRWFTHTISFTCLEISPFLSIVGFFGFTAFLWTEPG